MADVTTVHVTYDPETKAGTGFTGRKVKGTIHWVAAPYREDRRKCASMRIWWTRKKASIIRKTGP